MLAQREELAVGGEKERPTVVTLGKLLIDGIGCQADFLIQIISFFILAAAFIRVLVASSKKQPLHCSEYHPPQRASLLIREVGN